jgi:predicted nucleotidyltransferase
MPVRSLTSSVLKWPDREIVVRAIRDWSLKQANDRPELVQLGYFGSYARGNWGVGSDLDIIAVVSRSCEPFDRRGLSWDMTDLPVPAEIVVYTEGEWVNLIQENGLFVRVVMKETVWVIKNYIPCARGAGSSDQREPR